MANPFDQFAAPMPGAPPPAGPPPAMGAPPPNPYGAPPPPPAGYGMSPQMSAPYGRIIVLHVAIFAGVAAMIAWGEPLIGILGLLSLRIIWGVYLTVKRRLTLDSAAHKKS